MERADQFLRAILATVGRQTFPPERILEIMGPNAGEKQRRAFNLCDGSRTQGEIAKELGLDSGNLSKTLARWVDEGILIKVGSGRDVRPLNIYPLPETLVAKGLKS